MHMYNERVRGPQAVFAAIDRTPWPSVAIAWLCLVGVKSLGTDALAFVSVIEIAGGVLIAGISMGAWPREFGYSGFERWGIFAFVALFAALPGVALSGLVSVLLDLGRSRSEQSISDAAGAGLAVAMFVAWLASKGVHADAVAPRGVRTAPGQIQKEGREED